MKFLKKKNLHYIIFVVLLFFLIINMLFLLDTYETSKVNNEIKAKISKLMYLDAENTTLFQRRYNVDSRKLEDNIFKIKKIITSIENEKRVNDYFSDKKNRQVVQIIKKKIKKTKKIIVNFKSDFKELISKINSLIEANNKRDKNENVINKKYMDLITVHYKINSKIKNKDGIENFIKNIKNTNDKQYFVYLYDTTKAIEDMDKLELENLRINLSVNLAEFHKYFLEYSSDIVNQMYGRTLFFLFLVIIFLVGEYFYIYKIKAETRKLSQFQKAVQNSDNTVVITDSKQKLTYVNSAFEDETGYKKEEVLGQTPSILKSGLHDKAFYDEMKEKISHGESWVGEFANRKKDGSIIYEKASIFPIMDENKKLEGFLGIKLNITSEKKYLQDIEMESMEVFSRFQVDYSTGLWSRSVLDKELEEHSPGYIIYLKVKNFSDKILYYGVAASNEFVEKLAKHLKRFITVYHVRGQPFRVGESDFCILYNHKTPSVNLIEAINSFFDMEQNAIKIEETKHPVELQIGISSDEDLPNGNNRLLQGMVAALEAEDKSLPYAFYEKDNETEERHRNNFKVAQQLRYAIDKRLVIAQCQPIFNASDESLHAYEILMRVRDKDGKIMYPGQFLDVAKQTSLYSQLMHQIIDLTFKLIEEYKDISFSMNMSVLDMLDEDTINKFLRKLQACSNPENVIVEILESEGNEEYEKIEPFLREIKSRGCSISIDDFGSGYSNYYRIMQYDIDNIKIDGSIIKEIVHDKNACVVVETIVGFARKKNCKVVAEFVSSEEIYQKIKELGVDYVQGFHLGKPKELFVSKEV